MKWLIFRKTFNNVTGAHEGYRNKLAEMYISESKLIPETSSDGMPVSGRFSYTFFEPFATHFALDEVEDERIYSPVFNGNNWVLQQDQAKIDALAAESAAAAEAEQLNTDVSEMKATAIAAIDADPDLNTPIKRILKVLVRRA